MGRPYRTISYQSCPYCKHEFSPILGNYYYGKMVDLATGSGSSDVVVECAYCRKKYRVTVLIKFNARKMESENNK